MLPVLAAHPVLTTGFATFFFGFGAGALLNAYLISKQSPLVAEHRGSLDYVSSIVGDGLLLPAVNMVAVSFLIAHRVHIDATTLAVALALGLAITVYFHVVQAVRGLVNWTMPRPWRWNALGAWHAAYMFTVSTLLALFYSVLASGAFARDGGLATSAVLVTGGVLGFCGLLRLDYAAVSFRALVPSGLPRRVRKAP